MKHKVKKGKTSVWKAWCDSGVDGWNGSEVGQSRGVAQMMGDLGAELDLILKGGSHMGRGKQLSDK